VRTSLAVIPRSNLESDGPVAVGSSDAMNRPGTFDMGGNVREWVWNAESDGSRRFILGGGWSDPRYAFTDAYAQSALDRSPINGIRLMQYLGEEPRLAELQAPLARPHRDFFAETPVDDATFDIFLRQYDYDPGRLDAEIEETGEEDDWTWERVAFNAAYGGERMAAYVALPKNTEPPYQTVIYFPGSGALYSDDPYGRLARWEFFAKSGRAFVLPIYKSTYGRQDGVKSDYPEETVEYREHVVMWVKDFSRTIDYLETRDDIDSERLAYFGASWGGAMGGIVPAVEQRAKVVVLLVAGLAFQDSLPEVDVLHYLQRITQPVLMINGQYDFFFPVETSQRPMYELLGTPEEHKKWLVYPGTHSAPRQEYVKETLAWLDKYLGSVR
jgi:dienelactone hydrolase